MRKAISRFAVYCILLFLSLIANEIMSPSQYAFMISAVMLMAGYHVWCAFDRINERLDSDIGQIRRDMRQAWLRTEAKVPNALSISSGIDEETGVSPHDFAVILVDGAPVSNTIGYNISEGWVERYTFDAQDDPDKTERLYGTIEVKLGVRS